MLTAKFTKETSAFDSDARAGLDYLVGPARCTGRLGVMGICLGGHLAFRAAMNPDVLAGACFYATDLDTGTLGKGDDSLKRAGDIKGEFVDVVFRFARDSPLEESGFELLVPLQCSSHPEPLRHLSLRTGSLRDLPFRSARKVRRSRIGHERDDAVHQYPRQIGLYLGGLRVERQPPL
jgi:hypothetical protein